MHDGSHQLPAAPASSPHPLERKNGLSALLECRGRIEAHSQLTRIDLGVVERCREVFGEVFNAGTQEEKRQFVRLFIKKIDLNPDTGDILMHLFDRPTMLAPMQTPASKETGVRIELVAGAGFEPDSEQLSTVTAHWRYQGVKHAAREMARVGTAA